MSWLIREMEIERCNEIIYDLEDLQDSANSLLRDMKNFESDHGTLIDTGSEEVQYISDSISKNIEFYLDRIEELKSGGPR